MALAISETDGQAGKHSRLPNSYGQLIDWLKAAGRTREAEAVRERGVSAGVLKN